MDHRGRHYGRFNRNYVRGTMDLSGKYGADLGRIRFLKKKSEKPSIDDKIDNTNSAKEI